ncbi:MSCRAMM family protein [Leuconostoc pseudomesenteroides]|uniref:MSCRAMM family protein n=1 Tax=Leuconostoc pseudomesenteroides TaxID=33968 RepID=UPI00111D51CA|nr:SpaA isopeptide-forming pilin-related protein [Leuconostoc pseudomesenteroides]TOZ06652.1 hypothetical protein DIS14_04060 [Leuconostoc pseudomesenteroides]
MKKFTKKFFAGWQILVLLIPMLWQFGFSISTIHAEGATERTNHIEITPTGRTTPTASGTTDKAKFSFSSPLLDNGQMTRILNANNTTATANDGKTASLLVREKFDRNTANIVTGNGSTFQTARLGYHNQYQAAASNKNQSSYMVEIPSTYTADQVKNISFTVAYDNVGQYSKDTDNDGYGDKMVTLGAKMTVSNITGTVKDQFGATNYTPKFIDVPNNLYSGLTYRGIKQLDIEIQYYAVDAAGNLTNEIEVVNTNNANPHMTFASMNNFGATGTGRQFSWTEATTNIQHSTYAEMVAQVDTSSATRKLYKTDSEFGPKTSSEYGEAGYPSLMTGIAQSTDTTVNGDQCTPIPASEVGAWLYSTGHGNYSTSAVSANRHTNGNFVDSLDSVDAYTGAVSFNIAGTRHKFSLRSGTGWTWQSITAESISPLALNTPRKTVTAKETPDLNQPTDKGALNEQSLDEKLTPSNGYYYHNYYIYQQTYATSSVPNVPKPNQLVVDDTLPSGVTMENIRPDTSLGGATFNDVEVFNEDGNSIGENTINKLHTSSNKFSYEGSLYSVTLEKTNTGRQHIKIEMTAAGIAALSFTGKEVAFKLNVKTDAEKAINSGEREYFYNTAEVTSGSCKATNEVHTYEDPKLAGFAINKVDETGVSLDGAEFELYHKDDVDRANPIEHYAENSRFDFINLPIGDYILVETKAPNYHYITTSEYEINVRFDRATQKMVVSEKSGELTFDRSNIANVINRSYDHQFDIHKVDQANQPLAGAEFSYREVNDSTWRKLRVSADGTTFSLTGLQVGEAYEIREDKAPTGYEKIDNFSIYVDKDGIYHYSGMVVGEKYDTTVDDTNHKVTSSTNVVNEKLNAKVKIIKKDSDDTPLAGAGFEYRQKDATTWLSMTVDPSDASIHTTADDLALNTIYEIRESAAPSGYALIKDHIYFKFVVKSGKIVLERVNAAGVATGEEIDTTDVAGVALAELSVRDNLKAIMPLTGGNGFMTQLLLGSVLILGAGFAAYFTRKYKNS